VGEAPNYGAGKNKRIPCPAAPSPSSPLFLGYYYNHVHTLMNVLIKDGVRVFGAWNEPDKVGNPLHREFATAAILWGEAQRSVESNEAGCKHHCIVVAGEFAGYEPHHEYVEGYRNTIINDENKKGAFPTKTKPTFWGLHDYLDLENIKEELSGGKEVIARNYVNKEEREFVSHIKTKRMGSTHIWLSEQGVKVETESSPGTTKLSGNGELQRLAAQDFLRLGSPSARVERAYYYGYRGPSKEEKEAAEAKKGYLFDSALIKGEGYGIEPEDWRPAYCVLALGNHEGCPARVLTKAPIPGTTAPLIYRTFPKCLSRRVADRLYD
jgi:hypothetical protein